MDLPDPPPDELAAHLWGVNPADHLMIFETQQEEFGFLGSDGLLEPLTDVLGSGLRQSLADSTLIWARTAEPSKNLGPPGSPIAVAVRPDGTGIAERVRSTSAGLRGRLDGTSDDGTVDEPVSTLAAATTPGPCEDFKAVFARSRGWVFLAGALPGAGGSRGVRRITLSNDVVVDLPVSVELGRVLSATFDPFARELVVLDVEPRSHPERIRLVRIDGYGRDVRVVDSWRRFRRFDDLELLLDGRGRLLLTASKDHPRKHRVLEVFERNGRARAKRLFAGNERLATTPWSNETHLFVALENRHGRVRLDRVPLGPPGAEEDPGDVL
jgi:hypothetical protein